MMLEGSGLLVQNNERCVSLRAGEKEKEKLEDGRNKGGSGRGRRITHRKIRAWKLEEKAEIR